MHPFYSYSAEKNRQLIAERNISFEEIIVGIENGQLLDILEHPNLEKYAKQKIYVIEVRDYVYLVPFITDDNNNIFLKTIIPSRKAKRKYKRD